MTAPPAHYSHPQRYSADEVLGWPDDNLPHEVIEGALYVSPHANVDHQMLIRRLIQVIDPALPDGWEAVGPINLRLDADTLLVPDLAVLATVPWGQVAAAPAHVRLVVEVVSPGSTRIDRMVKPGLYTDAGLNVWVFDDLRNPGGPLLRTYRPGHPNPTTYPAGSTVPGAELVLPVNLDLAGLLR